MFLHRSFGLTFFTSLLCLSLFQTINAQTGVFSVTNITTDTAIDLYKGKEALFLWEISNEQGPIMRAFSTFNSTIELMAGPNEEASNVVVDVIAINLVFDVGNYVYPASLPVGLYHARVNTTVNTTRLDESKIQQVTGRSATINVTASSPIGCGPKKPAPFTNVPSPSDPKFTLLGPDV